MWTRWTGQGQDRTGLFLRFEKGLPKIFLVGIGL